MISPDQFTAAEQLTAEEIMKGDADTVLLIHTILPSIQAIPMRSHARAYAILFGILVADMGQMYKDTEVIDFDQNVQLFTILARTIYTAAKMDHETPKPPAPVPSLPKGPARLFHLVPRSRHAEDVPEPEPSDAAEGEDPSRPDPGGPAPGRGDEGPGD